ncbi:MAG: SDR family NAD(P)-dependent oxidoreductase, partial [Myxococcota bacterium]
ALAYVLAERGARLVLSSRRAEVLESLRDSLPRPEHHSVVPLDLERGEELERLAQKVEQEHGPIEALINSGGVSQRGFAIETGMDVVRRIMETNFFGTVALTRGVLPGMLERRSGRIVVISSVVGKFGTPKRSSYAASKHALHGYFDALRLEVEDAGVGVTLVCPGYVRTQVSQNALGPDGSPHAQMDKGQQSGTSPEAAALRIARAMEKDEREIYFGGREVFGVYAKRFIPTMFDRVLKRVNVT